VSAITGCTARIGGFGRRERPRPCGGRRAPWRRETVNSQTLDLRRFPSGGDVKIYNVISFEVKEFTKKLNV
jgi:hypothetical protein